MTFTPVKDAMKEIDSARDEVERASNALSEAYYVLSKLDPTEATRRVMRDSTDQFLHLFRVARSVIAADGVFDLYDLALATDDAQRALEKEN